MEGGGLPFPLLSVFGDWMSFALCTEVLAGAPRNIVVYKPEEGQSYDFSSCYAVQLQVVNATAPV